MIDIIILRSFDGEETSPSKLYVINFHY